MGIPRRSKAGRKGTSRGGEKCRMLHFLVLALGQVWCMALYRPILKLSHEVDSTVILQKEKLKLSYMRKCVQGQAASHGRARIQDQPESCCPQATALWSLGLRNGGQGRGYTKDPTVRAFEPRGDTGSHTCQDQGGTVQIWVM